MLFLKRTLLSLGLAALLLAPGVLSASKVASADGADGTVVVATTDGTPDVNTPTVSPGDDSTPTAEPTTDTSGDSQPGEFTDDQCTTSEDGNVQRCVNDNVAKSSATTTTSSAKANTTRSTKARSNAAVRAFPISVSVARPASDAPTPVADDATVEDEADATDDQATEAPNLPVTGSDKSDKGADTNTVSAALIVDDELALASSRASLLAFAACGAFAIVAVFSVVGARRLMPR